MAGDRITCATCGKEKNSHGWRKCEDGSFLCPTCKPAAANIVYQYRVLDKHNRLGRLRPDGTPYGIELPFQPIEHVDAQLLLAAKFQSRLIYAELDGRREYRRVRHELYGDIADLEQQESIASQEVRDAIEAIKAANAKERRKRATPEEQERKQKATAKLKDIREKLKAHRAVCKSDPRLREASDCVREAGIAKAKAEASASGLGWGTKALVVKAVKQAAGKLDPRPLRMHEWDGTGSLTIQLQQGGDKIRRHGPTSFQAIMIGKHNGNVKIRRVGKYHVFSLQIGMADNPQWVECPVFMDRIPPEKSSITWITLTRRREGRRFYHYLSLTLSSEAGWEKDNIADTGTVAVNPGWRLTASGLRVAYWIGSDGREGELLIPLEKRSHISKSGRRRHRTGSVEDWRRVRNIESNRDVLLEKYKAMLSVYIKDMTEPPAWLAEVGKFILLIRNQKRLENVVTGWQRHDGDEKIYTALRRWLKRDNHLNDFAAGLGLSFQRFRKDLYRRFWARLRGEYRTAILADVDYKTLMKNRKPEDNSSDDAVKQYLSCASPGKLVELCSMAAVDEIEAKDVTATCNICGQVCQVGAALFHACEHCGAVWDQDRNHCLNLLARA